MKKLDFGWSGTFRNFQNSWKIENFNKLKNWSRKWRVLKKPMPKAIRFRFSKWSPHHFLSNLKVSANSVDTALRTSENKICHLRLGYKTDLEYLLFYFAVCQGVLFVICLFVCCLLICSVRVLICLLSWLLSAVRLHAVMVSFVVCRLVSVLSLASVCPLVCIFKSCHRNQCCFASSTWVKCGNTQYWVLTDFSPNMLCL